MSEKPDLSELTDELYAQLPAEFVARRDEMVRQARASGDRELAAAIKALRRPSVGAWYLNSAVRAGVPGLNDLIQLGEQLRDAQARGDFASLRELGSRRNALTGAAIRQLGAHLAGIGVSATPAGLEEARTTLASALADPDVAEELSRGRLDRPHVYAGFGDLSAAAVSVSTRVASGARKAGKAGVAETAGKAEATRKAEAAEARAAEEAAARRDLEEAEAELAAVAARRDAADADVRAATQRVDELSQALAETRAALREAKSNLEDADGAQKAAQRRVDRARRNVQ